MTFPPSVPVKGILDFIHAVSCLERFERCREVHPTLDPPIIQRSKELCCAKRVALKALKALVESPDDSLLSELERRLSCLLVLARISNPIPRYLINPALNDTVWASHVLDDFLFIGPGSEFMQLKLGQPNAANRQLYAQRELIINQFIVDSNIRFILNVSKELIPGLQTDGERDYPVAFLDGYPLTCVKLEDLSGIPADNVTAQQLQSFIGVMVPMDDSEEFSTEFDQLVQVAALALELAWRRYVFAVVQYPSQPPPRVYLHCFGGLNRSTYTAVYWLVKYHGISPDQAWTSVVERRKPQCKEERPPLNGIVNGKLTGKNQWRDALRRVPDRLAFWPQLILSQTISQPLFALGVPSNVINTAEAAARAILNKMHSKHQESGVFMACTDLQTQLLCQSQAHPAFERFKHSVRQITNSDHQRSVPSRSTWPTVSHSAVALRVTDSEKNPTKSAASHCVGSTPGPIVDAVTEPLGKSSKSGEEQYHYLKVSGLRSSVSENSIFSYFRRFSASRDHIVVIKSTSSQYQLTFIGFRSFHDASSAKQELNSLRKPLEFCDCSH